MCMFKEPGHLLGESDDLHCEAKDLKSVELPRKRKTKQKQEKKKNQTHVKNKSVSLFCSQNCLIVPYLKHQSCAEQS